MLINRCFIFGETHVGYLLSDNMALYLEEIYRIHVAYTLAMEKAMTPHSSTLAWKIPWAEEPGRLQSMGSLRLNDFTFTFHFHALEKEMATHCGVLAWRIPGTGEPGGLPSVGSHRVGHDWSDLAAAAAYSSREDKKYTNNYISKETTLNAPRRMQAMKCWRIKWLFLVEEARKGTVELLLGFDLKGLLGFYLSGDKEEIAPPVKRTTLW